MAKQEECILCGQPALGYAATTQAEGGAIVSRRLCHDDSRSCYHLWTVYGFRTPDEIEDRISKGHLYLVQFWNDAPAGSSQEETAPTTGRQNGRGKLRGVSETIDSR